MKGRYSYNMANFKLNFGHLCIIAAEKFTFSQVCNGQSKL